MINFEVRNSLGVTVRTFGGINAAQRAIDFATAHEEPLGALTAYAVEIIRRERLLTEAPALAPRSARKKMAMAR